MKRAGDGGFDKKPVGCPFLGMEGISTYVQPKDGRAAGWSPGDFMKGGSQVCDRSRNSPRAEPSH